MSSGFGHWTGSNDGGGGGFPAGLVAAAAAAGVVVWAVAWLVPRVWVAVVCVCVACGATGIGLAVREVRRFPSWRPAGQEGTAGAGDSGYLSAAGACGA